jgi:hypothetical protein
MAGWLDGYLALILREIREGVNPTSDQTGGRTKGHGGRCGVTPTARSLPFGADAGLAPRVIVIGRLLGCLAKIRLQSEPARSREMTNCSSRPSLARFCVRILIESLVATLYPGYCAAKPISPHAKVKKPSLSSRRFSTIEESCSVIPSAHWPISNSATPTRWQVIPQSKGSLQRFPHTLERRDPDIPILKQAKAEYAKLQ